MGNRPGVTRARLARLAVATGSAAIGLEHGQARPAQSLGRLLVPAAVRLDPVQIEHAADELVRRPVAGVGGIPVGQLDVNFFEAAHSLWPGCGGAFPIAPEIDVSILDSMLEYRLGRVGKGADG
jgi:hypothetical protein